MSIEKITEKLMAVNEAQNAFATIESIRPDAIPQEAKFFLAELKLDLIDMKDIGVKL